MPTGVPSCSVSKEGSPVTQAQSCECVSFGANRADPGEKALEGQARWRTRQHHCSWAFVAMFPHVHDALVLVFSPRVLVC